MTLDQYYKAVGDLDRQYNARLKELKEDRERQRATLWAACLRFQMEAKPGGRGFKSKFSKRASAS